MKKIAAQRAPIRRIGTRIAAISITLPSPLLSDVSASVGCAVGAAEPATALADTALALAIARESRLYVTCRGFPVVIVCAALLALVAETVATSKYAVK